MTTHGKRMFCVVPALVLLGLLSPLQGAAQVIQIGDDFEINPPSGWWDAPSSTLETLPRIFFTHTPWDSECPGCFTAIWQANLAGTSVDSVLRRNFDGQGNPLGDEDWIADIESGFDSEGNIGGYAVSIVRDGSSSKLLSYDLYDPAGVFAGDTDEWAVHSGSFKIALDSNRNSVVVYQKPDYYLHSDRDGIFARRFDPYGDPIGGEFRVDTPGEHPIHSPEVGMDYYGNFIVAWRCTECEEDPNAPPSPWTDAGVRARRYDSDGMALGEDFTPHADPEGGQWDQSITMGPGGDFVVAWKQMTGSPQTTYFSQLFLRVFAADGSPLTGDVPVGPSYERGYNSPPKVAMADPDGSFMVTWMAHPGNGLQYLTYARWFDRNGVAWADPVLIGQTPSLYPGVAADLNGNYIVTWSDTDPIWEVLGRFYEKPVILSVNDFSVVEGDPLDGRQPESTAVFTVAASKPHPTLDVEVDFSTQDDTATFYEDYQARDGSLLFEANTTTLAHAVEVDINPDLDFELDEAFFLGLTAAGNAAIGRSKGVGTILNDDPEPFVTIGDIVEWEDDGTCVPGNPTIKTFHVPVTLSKAIILDVLVDFSTADGSVNPATAGQDYLPASGTIMIPAGYTDGVIVTEVLCDLVSENDEEFLIELTNPVNATILDPQGTATILDNDCYSISPMSHIGADAEGDSGTVHVTVTGAGCDPWTADTSDTWITLDSTGGTGDGEVNYTISPNPDSMERTGTATIAEWTFTVSQLASGCEIAVDPVGASFPTWGGTGLINVDAEPNDCEWGATTFDEWITIVSPAEGTAVGDGTVEFSVESNPGFIRSGSLMIGGHEVTVDQDGVFFDDFDDDVMAATWRYHSFELWNESGDSLRADASGFGQSAQAFATWAFAGCIEGTIGAKMRVDLFSTGTVMLYGWYLNDDNFVALTMNEFADRWTLTHRVDGVDVQSDSTAVSIIDTGVIYNAELSFDGAEITATIDGSQILNIPVTPGHEPDGTVGFGVFETSADFDQIMVSTVTPSRGLFWDGFESGDTSQWGFVQP